MSSGIFEQKVFTCPACGRPVMGKFSHEINPGDVMADLDGERRLSVEVKITGMAVSHSCIPQATR